MVYLGDKERVGLVDFSQTVQHLWELRGVNWLHGYLYHRLRVELQWTKYLCL